MKYQFSFRQPDVSRFHGLWQSLRSIAKFMVHPAQSLPPSAIHESTYVYQSKAKFYPYLSVDEEQRDWLEHVYHQSQ
ncbi:MAG: hypothetical protein AAF821_16720 [Cyanobacteria bacterium P01_D01_bin.156]